ncbi:AbfB domain-containing protein [Streptomyces caniscabiei]|uniref:AbfB domain-containing protein n=1 Tax=Streptomyces caniscabiei TaxID=2746961 RepID=UPI0029BE95C6|nr:AbfB domain-containing protein [Streptomyces caniscabiei]MDX2605197.1 AbfB domain-containing protein [Streptomyces caniscabiei]MDX2738355.1 AbfB domain-containing protein [Streptomyces caniscabiei]MDX2778947.1 AbfB domain-containing protein [Streptomyces caniscabiei]
MPPHKPGPDPDQTTPNLPVLRSAKVWETGVAPNDTRIPGTRRLWLAGALALAVVSSCVTAITLQGSGPDDSSEKNGRTTAADDRVLPSLSLPPTSPPATSAPDGKSGLSEPQGSEDDTEKNDADKDKSKEKADEKDDSSEKSQQGGAEPTQSAKPTRKPQAPVALKSVQSGTYRDRYWHLRDGLIQLDQVSSYSDRQTRRDSSFKVVSGLAKSSCYSFRLPDGRYARHQNFVLRASHHDGSQLFKQDATFCPRQGAGDVIGLESVNYPGYYLRQRHYQLRLERYEHNQQYWSETCFRVVEGLA